MKNMNMGVGLYHTINERKQCKCLPFGKRAPFNNYASNIHSLLGIDPGGEGLNDQLLRHHSVPRGITPCAHK